MKYHTALDVSLRSVSICIVDDEGNIVFESKTDSDVDKIVHCIRSFNSEIQTIGFEAGALTQYLTYGLQEAGFEVICLESRQVSVTLSAMRNKTTSMMPGALLKSFVLAGTDVYTLKVLIAMLSVSC